MAIISNNIRDMLVDFFMSNTETAAANEVTGLPQGASLFCGQGLTRKREGRGDPHQFSGIEGDGLSVFDFGDNERHGVTANRGRGAGEALTFSVGGRRGFTSNRGTSGCGRGAGGALAFGGGGRRGR